MRWDEAWVESCHRECSCGIRVPSGTEGFCWRPGEQPSPLAGYLLQNTVGKARAEVFACCWGAGVAQRAGDAAEPRARAEAEETPSFLGMCQWQMWRGVPPAPPRPPLRCARARRSASEHRGAITHFHIPSTLFLSRRGAQEAPDVP